MPLSATILQQEIQKITDGEYVGFKAYPETIDDAALKWAEAVGVYFQQMVTAPAIPVTPTVIDQAVQSCKGIWLPMFADQSPVPTTLAGFQNGFQTFVALVAGQMTATDPLYSWMPPVTPAPPFSDIFLAGKDKTAKETAKQIATRAHTWMKTGTFVQKLTPFTVVPWTSANP